MTPCGRHFALSPSEGLGPSFSYICACREKELLLTLVEIIVVVKLAYAVQGFEPYHGDYRKQGQHNEKQQDMLIDGMYHHRGYIY